MLRSASQRFDRDVLLLCDETHAPRRELPGVQVHWFDLNSIASMGLSIASLGDHPPGIVPGHADLPVLYFFRSCPGSGYYWVIEYDVQFTANWGYFFDACSESGADLLATAVLTLAEADAELHRLAILKKNHADEQYLARRALRELPTTIAGLEARLADLRADRATLAAHAGDPVTLGGRKAHREDVSDALGKRLDALPETVFQTARVPLGVYRGLPFGMVRHPNSAPEVFLEGATARHAVLSREHHGPAPS